MEKLRYFLKADSFIMESEEKNEGYLEVINGYFGSYVEEVPENSTIMDWSGYRIAPGLFDTHIHGINNYDIMDGSVEAVQEISKSLLSLGVTRFLPTTLTSSTSDLHAAISAVKQAVEQGLEGAQSEGIFLEGPYFTEKYKGAQNPSYFRDPDYGEFQEWQELSGGTIVKIALAPEREGSLEFIRTLHHKGIEVSIAHTDASFERVREAIDAGASHLTHLFNGMSGLHHREPGVVGAALTDTRAFAELICDGHHVHPEVAALAAQIKGEKLILITDCMRAGLMPDGNYHLGEFPVVMKDGIARTESGSLAGSTLKLIDGIKNLYSWSGKSLHEVWHLASLSPAKSLGREDKLGSIAAGKIADYVVVDDSFSVRATAVAGEVRYGV